LNWLPEEHRVVKRPEAVILQELNDHHNEVMQFKRKRKLTDKVRKILRARLKSFTPEELKQVSAIASGDPFWRGQNDRRKAYDAIPNIFLNDDRVAAFLEQGSKGDLGASDVPTTETRF